MLNIIIQIIYITVIILNLSLSLSRTILIQSKFYTKTITNFYTCLILITSCYTIHERTVISIYLLALNKWMIICIVQWYTAALGSYRIFSLLETIETEKCFSFHSIVPVRECFLQQSESYRIKLNLQFCIAAKYNID